MKCLRVGVTGGMGCGKSTVVAEFQRLGVPAFVADRVGGSYYADPAFLAQVRDLLGHEVILPTGEADKQAIAHRVFADPEAMQALNALVHPRVMEDFDAFCHQHADAPYVLFESAILYDYGFDRLMDRVVCVYLSLEERLARLRLRDQTNTATLMARIDRQLPAEVAMQRADYVVLNYEGNPRQRQVAYIDKQLRQ